MRSGSCTVVYTILTNSELIPSSFLKAFLRLYHFIVSNFSVLRRFFYNAVEHDL